ncbi:hypothetical protein O6H91_01G011200 [Diphasiastrum complanatum]|uniref:Uncharacterized protein n=3 Tax=Diphasiastrum complanatum TaxID=34168 RepID=A0ACC2EN29_DIPCM|nr:hypothetical protein O6H91_01G011200 [Diphasiastrum complanatum]KAJ7567896.1 hypothetical protein O6H91_01G011200 [Diphasiastrum complanatum]KAJ7567897.1 hypothetical protein O6H91_01G011200 [Diphasiastrum complanatum]
MEDLKAAGNDAVHNGNYLAALDFYKQAIDAVEENKVDDLAALHSNCSFAHLKLGQSQEALVEADLVVALKTNWSKGYFRRGEAYFALKDYYNAERAYAKASELSPDDTSIKKKLTLTQEAMTGFYFRQLLPGRDFCKNASDFIEQQIFSSAVQMQNYIYLVGDAKTREAVVVDAAWDVKGIKAYAAGENINLVGAVVTHYHFDHTGGVPPPPFDAFGIKVPGIRELAVEDKLPVYVNKNDAKTLLTANEVPSDAIVELEDSAVITVGTIKLQFIHTPGHTPGSQCMYIQRSPQDMLLSGDTLFIGSCGRLDLPDCDTKAMYTSLQKKLAVLPDSTRVYPGHNYGGPYTSIGDEKKTGFLRPISEKEWLKRNRL